MTIVKYVPLEAPPLVQTEDLLPYVYAQIESTSAAGGNPINDFSDHSPIAALAQGLDFSMRELRYWLNKFALTTAINHLKIAGVQRRLSVSASVTLTFTLSARLSNPFFLSAGYLVTTQDGLEFLTSEALVIPAGAVSGSVTASARNGGSSYNVPRGAISQISETRAFLQGVTNLEAAQGGLDEETQEEVLSRGFASLRYRGILITSDDFEQEALRILGAGAVARAVGNLAPDRLTYERGSVHLFLLNADGTQPTQSQLSTITAAMESQTPTFLREKKTTAIASALYASPIDLQELELYVVAALTPGDNPEKRAQLVYSELLEYLKPGGLPIGETVLLKELENVVRRSGVRNVQSVAIHIPSLIDPLSYEVVFSDLPLETQYTAAKLIGATIDLVDASGNAYVFPFGETRGRG